MLSIVVGTLGGVVVVVEELVGEFDDTLISVDSPPYTENAVLRSWLFCAAAAAVLRSLSIADATYGLAGCRWALWWWCAW